jgi:sialic acid synthase SpsE/mannose-6-phosphate isomerase-like protein (cupin superfamily)
MTENGFDFNDLFVLDMANNHQGDVEHGKNIIRQMAEVVHQRGAKAALKFQFRQLDTFVHPDHREGSDNKHIPRFLSTEMKRPVYEEMLAEVRKQDLLAMCTPFDEESVDAIVDMGFDIIKVASCSATDWPLLEKIATANLPTICSTGGLDQAAIDGLYSFFFHRGSDFALMHCVSIYPTPAHMLNLNQIETMVKRHNYATIGWSTHEEPDNLGAVQVAYAKGARIFERHVGATTDEIQLNAYSSTATQVDRWIASCQQAKEMCGGIERPPAPQEEVDSIVALQRGVFARKPIKKGTELKRDLVFFAMPCQDNQVTSGAWRDTMRLSVDIDASGAIYDNSVEPTPIPPESVIKQSIHLVKALLNEAAIPLNSDFEVEYSHHYGLENFLNTGAVLIKCVDREYCKKIIVQLPGQTHPSHYHKSKEETFQILRGVLEVEIDKHRKTLRPGDTCLVQPGVWHSFWTDTGCVFEEISSRDLPGDSVYAERQITLMERSERKTLVDHWGRFQFGDGRPSWQ